MKKLAVSERSPSPIHPRNGFCNANSTFYSKRNPLPLPANSTLDVTTFISSQAHHGTTTAFIEAATGRRLSFSDLWRAVDNVADALYHDMGIRRGDVVLILSPNSISIPVVCLSVMSLGAVITTANPLNTASEISRQVEDCSPKLAFATLDLAPKLTASRAISVVLTEDDEERVGSALGVRVVGNLSEMMKKKPRERRVRDRVNQDETAMLLYSSGTTGRSKGVLTSHGNLIAHVARFIAEPLEPNQTFLCTVPLFHTFGLLNYVIATVALGSTVVILRKFDLHGMTAAIEKYSATTLVLVPPVVIAMINGSDLIKATYDLTSLKTVRSGGAPLSKEITECFMEKYPTVDIFQGYALTESNSSGASTDSVEESKRCGAVGLLSSGVEARIVDSDTGRVMGVNETGELWLKGPAITKGYFRNEEATKELIKYKAYQVPPAELEGLLLTHPEIIDAAVIPFPDREVGQFPMAYVVKKTGSLLSEKSLMEFVAKQVAPYKRVRKVAFVSSIPKNPSGKILRKDLIKLATSSSRV